ncbi:MAG: MATE family efflux transporter, partial [Armatimonadia bacterium]
VLLDYLLIFGTLGLPRLGIAGAAYATVASSFLGALVFMVLFLRSPLGREYQVWARRGLDLPLLGRLLRFGAPSGLHFMLDILAWSMFIMLVGRLGTNALAATNLAFQVNTVVFLPMIGFSIATSTLVGHRLGENRPELAVKTTWSAFQMTFSYMFVLAVLYLTIPDLFILPFAAGADAAQFSQIRGTVVILLHFVAVYSLFDGANLIFSAALKGAGDTLFVMIMSTGLSMSLMVVPTWLICHDGKGSIWAAWLALTAYICVLALCFVWRFLRGRWKTMRVTEVTHAPVSPTYAVPDHPFTDADITAS